MYEFTLFNIKTHNEFSRNKRITIPVFPGHTFRTVSQQFSPSAITVSRETIHVIMHKISTGYEVITHDMKDEISPRQTFLDKVEIDGSSRTKKDGNGILKSGAGNLTAAPACDDVIKETLTCSPK